MIKKLFLILFFFLVGFRSIAGGGLLDIVVNIDIKNQTVKSILITIEEKTAVSFTYSPDMIDVQKVVSLSIQNKTIRQGLQMIFGDGVRFKEVGNHIILLKNETKEDIKALLKEDLDYIFIGVITDKSTGKPIKEASIYEIEDRNATLSDDLGFYSLTVPATHEVVSLYIKKKGYREKVIVLKGDGKEKLLNDIALDPIMADVSLMTGKSVSRVPQNINDRAISGQLVSDETYLHGENLDEIDETRWAQVSLVPSVSIGSNLSTNALINNHFSLNVLGGYSKGVKGVEIGGLFNLNKENVTGLQIGGIANLVGGDVTGFQVGGLANLLQGNATGAQIAGISTIMKRDLKGLQLAGVSAIVRGGFEGAQISGVSNITWKSSRGAQISGVFNMVKDSLYGGQISGVSNFSNGGVNFLQIAGVSNFAHKNYGLQIASIQNFTRENNGLQIGLFNSSIRGKGVAIGLFNFVKEGYHKTEISANEIFPINVIFKTGTQRLYNTYNFGARFGNKRAYAMGLGFGSYFNLTKNEKLKLSLDLSGQLVFENDFKAVEFAQLYKVSTTIDYQLAKWVTVFAGPSFNLNMQQFADVDGAYSTDISFMPIADNSYSWGRSIYWIGGQVGFRF
ncbi:STN domain-containing protein [Paracrocinitomix mangrovi]|uniref:STN domain-containing protein n=1 Tax=Paracrocinitomix mangrovi TaxID=2862509 RepID=UPI001C8E017A|nr:STN domain-containing protein [Paracrocinitomix mangrovi]UKN01078.1 STN domain-containing protein [Paracrocinitomix mangrovi]